MAREEVKLADNERLYGFIANRPVIHTVESTEYFCRNCGVKGLKVETGEGDYYVGPSYYCDACGDCFTMG